MDIEQREKVILVGVDDGEDENFEQSMEELKNLAKACNMTPVGMITQSLPCVNKGLCIGTGKVVEVKEFATMQEADIIVFDNTLTPTQMRNLQKELDMPILDRTTLILDIFSTRAQTREAKLQVETARLQYLLPRLVGMHQALSRQGGASGSLSNKGAGEKKLELDRRKIEHQITEMKKELEEVATERETQRKRRVSSRIPQVSLVGYTNAGKSTMMNAMVEEYVKDDSKKVLVKDMLFATLETSVRKMDIGDNKSFFLADTVGFIHKLPHGLVKAFRSTLEEVKNADLILHVIDFSDENYKHHMQVTEDTLQELGAGDIPVIYVYNKADLCDIQIPAITDNGIYMSAKNKNGLSALIDLIKSKLFNEYIKAELLIPYDKGNVTSYFMEHASVISQNYVENGVQLVVNCHKSDADKYGEYLITK